jgi:hypothetical protein
MKILTTLLAFGPPFWALAHDEDRDYNITRDLEHEHYRHHYRALAMDEFGTETTTNGTEIDRLVSTEDSDLSGFTGATLIQLAQLDAISYAKAHSKTNDSIAMEVGLNRAFKHHLLGSPATCYRMYFFWALQACKDEFTAN